MFSLAGMVIVVVALFATLVWRLFPRPPSVRDRMKAWAGENELEIVRAERRYLSCGPFRWKRAGVVFRVEVRMRDGRLRKGWIRFGYDAFSRQPWSESSVWDESL